MVNSGANSMADLETSSMRIQIKGKQIDVGDALRTHVEDNLNTIVNKYFSNPIEASVVFSKEAHLFCAEISVHAARGIILQSHSSANDAYPAFDEAAARMAKRLSRYKKRLTDMHKQPSSTEKMAMLTSIPANQYVLDPDKHDANSDNNASHEPLIIAETQMEIPHLAVSEAVMHLDLSQQPALLFHNRATGLLNMVYLRPDGHIGWVDPSNTK